MKYVSPGWGCERNEFSLLREKSIYPCPCVHRTQSFTLLCVGILFYLYYIHTCDPMMCTYIIFFISEWSNSNWFRAFDVQRVLRIASICISIRIFSLCGYRFCFSASFSYWWYINKDLDVFMSCFCERRWVLVEKYKSFRLPQFFIIKFLDWINIMIQILIKFDRVFR